VRVVAALLIAVALQSGCEPDPGHTSRAVRNAVEAPAFEAVVGLLADGELFCSGTLIAPRVVLTAAHCVDRYVADQSTVIAAFFGASIDQPGPAILAERLVRHPDWRVDDLPNDIGLVALAENAPVDPLPASTVELTTEMVGTDLTLVGFGLTGPDSGDSGIRRAGTAGITGIDDQRIALNSGPEGASTCAGDSGGPSLLDGRVVGIHSRSSCSTLSLDERVDVHANFIDPFVAEHPAIEDSGCNAGGGGSLSWLALLMLAAPGARRLRDGQ
jgi:secreted trypsin-like serine protease